MASQNPPIKEPAPGPEAPAEAGASKSIAEEAARTIEEVRRMLESATPEDLPERAAAVKKKLEGALGAIERVAREQAPAVAASLARGQETVEREVASAEETIRENPLAAVLVAAGFGFVLGLLVRRGK